MLQDSHILCSACCGAVSLTFLLLQAQGGDGYSDSQQTVTSLSAGDSLRKGSTMTSADGQSKLVFQGDGNIVVCTTPDLL